MLLPKLFFWIWKYKASNPFTGRMHLHKVSPHISTVWLVSLLKKAYQKRMTTYLSLVTSCYCCFGVYKAVQSERLFSQGYTVFSSYLSVMIRWRCFFCSDKLDSALWRYRLAGCGGEPGRGVAGSIRPAGAQATSLRRGSASMREAGVWRHITVLLPAAARLSSCFLAFSEARFPFERRQPAHAFGCHFLPPAVAGSAN